MSDIITETAQRTQPRIHPSAMVDPGAQLDAGVIVGPWTMIGPNVRVGAGTEIGPHVLIEKDTDVGEGCRISQGAVLGTDPQDLKYGGEDSRLVVGDRTVIREYATLNRGTAASGETVVGNDCMLMAYSHIAHDSVIGSNVVIANAVNMAGHVLIEDWAIVGGLTAIHQFVRIGAHAFVGGATRASQDVAPYCRVAGSPAKLYGLNSVGMERRGFTDEMKRELKKAYRIVFQSSLNISQALARAHEELRIYPEIEHFLSFIEASERGMTS
ncbi:MAG: acyl-ACP--UDP-N-acetylglucosamine O-acyltransferase [Gemmatimonadetes bacterium]|nr:acyl-ACP--UDP-N-acetylglucosamine O-acyltransferase [Gemmatimonadota bacterium]